MPTVTPRESRRAALVDTHPGRTVRMAAVATAHERVDGQDGRLVQTDYADYPADRSESG